MESGVRNEWTDKNWVEGECGFLVVGGECDRPPCINVSWIKKYHTRTSVAVVLQSLLGSKYTRIHYSNSIVKYSVSWDLPESVSRRIRILKKKENNFLIPTCLLYGTKFINRMGKRNFEYGRSDVEDCCSPCAVEVFLGTEWSRIH
jgi:hypothetical protein